MGNQHITTIDGTTKSKTWTKHEVEEFSEAKQIIDRIEKLGLILSVNEIMYLEDKIKLEGK
jgi:cell division protein FtsL